MKTLFKNKMVPLSRMLFVEKNDLTLEQLVIEATGPYSLDEREECFVIRNDNCCKAILVTVKVKED